MKTVLTSRQKRSAKSKKRSALEIRYEDLTVLEDLLEILKVKSELPKHQQRLSLTVNEPLLRSLEHAVALTRERVRKNYRDSVAIKNRKYLHNGRLERLHTSLEIYFNSLGINIKR